MRTAPSTSYRGGCVWSSGAGSSLGSGRLGPGRQAVAAAVIVPGVVHLATPFHLRERVAENRHAPQLADAGQAIGDQRGAEALRALAQQGEDISRAPGRVAASLRALAGDA